MRQMEQKERNKRKRSLKCLPYILIIDREGNIRYSRMGFKENKEYLQDLEHKITLLLQGNK